MANPSRQMKNRRSLWMLKSIEIESLFGKFDFPSLELGQTRKRADNINFLYGDNGAGKTTILKIVYSLLSSEIGRGNKTYLAQLKFKRITMRFEGNLILEAARTKSSTGSYTLKATSPNKSAECVINVADNDMVKLSENPDLVSVFQFIEEQFPSVVFVTDLRTFRSSDSDSRPILRRRRYNLESEFFTFDDQIQKSDLGDLEALTKAGLSRTLQMAKMYLSDWALKTSTEANRSAGNIYLEIARAITNQRTVSKADTDISSLVSRVKVLQPDIKRFQTLGFRDGDSLSKIAELLNTANKGNEDQLVTLLSPYISSLEERLDQSRDIFELMEVYRDSLNSFFKDKMVTLSIGKPISFFDSMRNPLEPSQLSSGERHLIYLCTIALLSNQSNSILLIDEPELSLNYKWQSILVERLAEIAGPSSQFIMATHSFEIIANNRNSIRMVEPQHVAAHDSGRS